MERTVQYKDDWEKSKERFLAFWEGEIVDRCCIAVYAPSARAMSSPPPTAPLLQTEEELRRYWLDPEYSLQRKLAWFERTFHGGEAYPATTMCVGASAMAAFYGSPVEYRADTAWFHPAIDNLETFDWTINLENAPLYRETIETTRYFAQECRGRYLVGLPELGSATDDLSLLRGMQSLVYDMIESPDAVKRGIAALVDTWQRVHRLLFDIALPCNEGGCCIPWMQTWAPGPHYQMSCDFSTVLSPAMFEEFIIPELQRYMEINTYSVYHWDGPDEVKHLDALLGLKELKAIQWTPGAGQPPTASLRWIPLYKRIQAEGKRLILPFVETNEVEPLLAQLSARGLFLVTSASSEEEARDLLKKVEKWTRK